MFYCEKCRKDRGWPESFLSSSRGACEICGKNVVCHDVNSTWLPKKPANREDINR